MKILLLTLFILPIFSGCTINDATKKKVNCLGVMHISTLGRDYIVKLKARREGKRGVSYYTSDPSFLKSWVSEKNFKKIICE